MNTTAVINDTVIHDVRAREEQLYNNKLRSTMI